MKKVGIITFHDGFNYGAFMQVFSLKKAIEGLGVECEVINYKNAAFYIKEFVHYAKKDGDISANIRKIKKFLKFHKEYLDLGPLTLSPQKINRDYDAVFFGSDEIWNINNAALKTDLTYFGKNIDSKKIAYAPSFGSTDLNDSNLENVKELLRDFSHIAVRDYNSKAIIKELLGAEPPVVPDPTFLIDHEPYVKISPFENYILLYAPFKFKGEAAAKILKEAKTKNQKIISIGFKQDVADYNILDADPFEWLGYIKHAEKIITSMFHGTVFSIIFNKDFKTILTKYREKKFSATVDFFSIGKNLISDLEVIDIEVGINNFDNQKKNFREKGEDYLKTSLGTL
ncbi:polysaccharide pyruvyl transferase family protein [Kushneria sp. AK178]